MQLVQFGNFAISFLFFFFCFQTLRWSRRNYYGGAVCDCFMATGFKPLMAALTSFALCGVQKQIKNYFNYSLLTTHSSLKKLFLSRLASYFLKFSYICGVICVVVRIKEIL